MASFFSLRRAQADFLEHGRFSAFSRCGRLSVRIATPSAWLKARSAVHGFSPVSKQGIVRFFSGRGKPLFSNPAFSPASGEILYRRGARGWIEDDQADGFQKIRNNLI